MRSQRIFIFATLTVLLIAIGIAALFFLQRVHGLTPVAQDSGSPVPVPSQANPEAPTVSDEASSGDVIYRVLSLRLDRSAEGHQSLTFLVRFTNTNTATLPPLSGTFWSEDERRRFVMRSFDRDHFRLLVEGVPLAPDKAPDELVEGDSAREGNVSFTLPDTLTARTVYLQCGNILNTQNAKGMIPVDLRRWLRGLL